MRYWVDFNEISSTAANIAVTGFTAPASPSAYVYTIGSAAYTF